MAQSQRIKTHLMFNIKPRLAGFWTNKIFLIFQSQATAIKMNGNTTGYLSPGITDLLGHGRLVKPTLTDEILWFLLFGTL